MSKIRQAVNYESGLSRERAKANRELADAARAQLQQALEYERALTNQQFDMVRTLQGEHQRFHDREHILYDDAIEKSSVALRAQIDNLEGEIGRLRELSHAFLSTERFEREHQALIDRMQDALNGINERLADEAKVTVRQEASQATIDKITQSNRWLIGIAVTSGLSLAALIMHLLGLY